MIGTSDQVLFTHWPIGMSFNIGSPHELEELQAAGIQCIELTWQNLDIFEPNVYKKCEEFLNAARRLGIQVNSLHIPYGDEWDPSSLNASTRHEVEKKVVRIFEMAKLWEVPILIFHPSYEPIPSIERTARLENAKESLSLLAKKAQDYGVRIAVECLPRTCLGNTSDEIAYLIEDSPNLGICCDVNHLLQELPEDFIQRLGERIITTHISDNDGLDEKHWMPGEGVIHWQEVIQALRETGYHGAFLYETRQVAADEVARNCRTLLGQDV